MAVRSRVLLRTLLGLGFLALIGTVAYEIAQRERQCTVPGLPPGTPTGERATPSIESNASPARAALPTGAEPAAHAPDPRLNAQVAGRVVDEKGSPIRGASVRFVEFEGVEFRSLSSVRAENVQRGEESTTTDAQGRFGFASRGSVARAHLLGVESEGFAPLECFVSCLVEPQHDFGDLVLLAGGELCGRVVDGQGRPVEGCELRWARTNCGQLAAQDPGVRAGVSGAGGRFRLEHLPQGLLRVCAGRERLPSDWSAPVSVAAGATSADLEIVVEPAVCVRGSVRDATSDAPLEARVVLFPHSGERFLSGTCAADGSFELWCRAASGSLTYSASAPGHQGNGGENVLRLPPDGSDPALLTIRLTPLGGVAFQVRDAAGGQPLPGAELVWIHGTEERTLRTGAPPIFEALGADARADAAGWIRITPGELRGWRAIVRATAHVPHFCNIDELGQPNAVVELSAGALLEVELRGEGMPISGVAVELRPSGSVGLKGSARETEGDRDLRAPLERRTSDAQGKVRFDDLPASTYSVQARGAQASSETLRDLELAEGAQRTVVLNVAAACSISGRVAGSDAGGAAQRIVARESTGRCYGATVDARGNYSIAGLPPGRYEVGRAWAGTRLGKHAEALELHAGEQARLDLDAHLVRLRGRVLLNREPAGRCALSFVARADPVDPKSREEWLACTDRDGRFELLVADDYPGRLRVEDHTANTQMLSLASRELDPAGVADEIELDLATGPVEFECLMRGSTTPVEWAQVQLAGDPAAGGVPGFQAGQNWIFTLPPSGRTSVAALPVGNYRVTSTAADGLRSEPGTLCVRAGETVHLLLEFSKGK